MCAAPGKVEAINAMKDVLENKGEIRTFMGKIQFFGQWIKDLGELAAPLYANLKDEVPEKLGSYSCRSQDQDHSQDPGF